MLSNIKRQYRFQKALWSIVPARGIYITLWILLTFVNYIILFELTSFELISSNYFVNAFLNILMNCFITGFCIQLSNPYHICNSTNSANTPLFNKSKTGCNNIHESIHSLPVKTADILKFQLYNTLINSVISILWAVFINLNFLNSRTETSGFIGLATVFLIFPPLLFHLFSCVVDLKCRFAKLIWLFTYLIFIIIFITILGIGFENGTVLNRLINSTFLQSIAGIPGIIISLVVTPALLILTNKIIIKKHKSRTVA